MSQIEADVSSDGYEVTGKVTATWDDPSIYAAMEDSEKLRDKLAALVIAQQDDLTMEQAEAFFAEFHDDEHNDCPHGNYRMCPKCRCDVAQGLMEEIMYCIETEGYEICAK